MSDLDPFGRPLGGGPSPLGGPRGPHRSGRLRAFVVGFIVFDLLVLGLVGALFAIGVFGGSDSSDTVIIPPSAEQVAQLEDDDDDDDDDVPAAMRETEPATPVDSDPGDVVEHVDGEPVAAMPAGLNASSMIRERNLRPALAEAKRLAPGRVTMLSLHPTHFMAQVRAGNGDMITVTARYDQPTRVMSRTPGAGNAQKSVAWSSIDPSAPERLTKTLKAGGESGPRSVSHLVVMPVFAPWALHRKNGKHTFASANGTPRQS